MQTSQGTPWLLHLILSPVLLCFLNQRGSHCTKKMLRNCPAEKYTCDLKLSPPILESRELIHCLWESRELIHCLCWHLSVCFTIMPVGLLVTFWFTLFANLAAIARAMEEWERRKEEGEVGNEPETEEENIYAVSKEQEVQCRHFVKNAPGLLSANWACVWDWVGVESKGAVELFAEAILIFLSFKGCAGKWLKIRPPKHSHSSIQRNTDPGPKANKRPPPWPKYQISAP